MIGEICGRLLRDQAALMVLVMASASPGNLIAQNFNLVEVSPTEVIGSSVPTVQRPVRRTTRRPTGRLGQNPPPTTPAQTGGMSYQIQFGQEIVVGYVATEITIRSQSNFASDREWVFRFQGVEDQVFPPGRNLVVDVPISIQQGTVSQTFTRYLPRWAITRQIAIDVLEEGRVIPELSAEVGLPANSAKNSGFVSVTNSDLRYPGIALQSEQSLDALIVIAGEKPEGEELKSFQSFLNSGRASVEVQPVNRMPTDWRAYQRFDVVVLSSNLMVQLSQQPEAFAAVRQWLMIGGTVVVIGDDNPRTIIATLEVSDAPEQMLDEKIQETLINLGPYWTQIEANQERNVIDMTEAIAKATPAELAAGTVGNYGNVNLTPQQNLDRFKSKRQLYRQALARSPQQWSQRIWIRPVAAGQILGVIESSETEVFQAPDLDMVYQLIDYRKSPMLRRGVDPMIGDARFRDWLIPGVAQPPVYTFIGLLTVFVILVGPVAYRQTARHHRSHLMFLIAPALALITTVMMFSYGIISEGFGTMARIRQLTIVDGVSKSGAERIRSTYFAGVRPADGLRFGGSDEVMAYPETRGVAWRDLLADSPQRIGKVVINENSQRFDSSFLPSRNQKQFVVHRPVNDIGSLRVGVAADGSVTFDNGFDFPLRRIVVRRSKEQYLIANLIRPGSSSKATVPETKAISKKLGSLYNDFRPILSTIIESKTYGNSGKTVDLLRETMQTINGRNSYYDGVFESAFREALQTRVEIPVGHFVAISDVSEDVVAVKETEQVGCVRYIMGTFVEKESQ